MTRQRQITPCICNAVFFLLNRLNCRRNDQQANTAVFQHWAKNIEWLFWVFVTLPFSCDLCDKRALYNVAYLSYHMQKPCSRACKGWLCAQPWLIHIQPVCYRNLSIFLLFSILHPNIKKWWLKIYSFFFFLWGKTTLMELVFLWWWYCTTTGAE